MGNQGDPKIYYARHHRPNEALAINRRALHQSRGDSPRLAARSCPFANLSEDAGLSEDTHPAFDDLDEEEAGIVIVDERDGPPRRRWVRYVMPVMVEVDPETGSPGW
ncbi:hypothetical protein [Nonomuraea sp. NPDC050540]|uniref:hypothetical protein n=1 Tax=Nonomuraea sp. NPDC050540 TaxID=3364367 RepID=UPI0037BA4E6F